MESFWNRVDNELEFLGKNRTYLANKCGFTVANIGKGIKLGSTPSAETAVKIAQVLGVSVEYLVNGVDSSFPKTLKPEVAEIVEEINHLEKEDLEAIKYIIKMRKAIK
ncbi:MAG: helix-turn-helix transcriptional regulator [Treponemataceae bacterium]|jgi:transcriptional regulator with XRE-family HTH domain|nr:helix-turn-helix transcriptional regulator [Spirochaetaceae bacterium]MEE0878823.1 helix-turn-helix transcriptional regulator [Treponemataceae bacterium]